MYAPLSHILPMTMIQRKRSLPVPGRILVRQGQTVSPMDVVGETEFSNKHVLLDVASLLHISSEEADSLINCQVGDKVMLNQVIAPARGFFSFPVLSPVDGHVILVGEGQVLLEAGDSRLELLANYPGRISQVFQDKAVEITAEGSLIQGIWGNGKFNFGNLQSNFNNESADNSLNVDRLNTKYRGSIVFAEHCSDKKALKMAADLPVRGLILGSISSDLLKEAVELDFPIMVTEGFGNLPMSSIVYTILENNINNDVVLVSNNFDPYSGIRPEIFIPVVSPGKTPPAMDYGILSTGSRVRIILNPGLSRVGTVAEIMENGFEFSVGLNLPAAEIKLENGEKEIVPLVNLEVIN